MTNNHLTPQENEVTPNAKRQSAGRSRPSVRRVALIGTDGSRFRLVAAATNTLAPTHP
jgi:hypothetical protein